MRLAMACSLVMLGLSGSSFAFNSGVTNFSQAKALLKSDFMRVGDSDYYCGCPMQRQGKKWVVDLANCGYEVRKNQERAERIEIEHVVPAADFGRQRACWREGGRKNCEATDPEFARIEGDPHNLIPVVGEVNGDRGAMGYGMLTQSDGFGYGQCGSRIDFKQRTFMPRVDARGDIARTYFYFNYKYGFRLSARDQALFIAWGKLDPVDERECRKNAVIARKAGFDNPYVTQACQRAN